MCGAMLMPAAQLKQVSRGISAHHAGLDLTAPYGSPVRSAAAGTVVFAGRYFGYGHMVDVRHADGTVTRYAHLSSYAAGIRPGAEVGTGGLLGQIGTSGRAHGAHLHFEVRVGGVAVDPKPFLSLAACTPATGPARERLEEARSPASAPRSFIDRRPGGLLD
jgi:murein DD-endopeptidase MepM/ murein hydrolase activator NlpD